MFDGTKKLKGHDMVILTGTKICAIGSNLMNPTDFVAVKFDTASSNFDVEVTLAARSDGQFLLAKSLKSATPQSVILVGITLFKKQMILWDSNLNTYEFVDMIEETPFAEINTIYAYPGSNSLIMMSIPGKIILINPINGDVAQTWLQNIA